MRVGVTGHRALQRVDAVAAAVDEALDEIAEPGSVAELVVVSSLAEGADRIVAEAALRRGGRLEVILPLPADDYEADFATEGSRRQFHDLLAAADQVCVSTPATVDDSGTAVAPSAAPAVGDARIDAYERAGLAVVEACDVLLALWDGGPAQGRGGTAEIMAAARAAGRRVEVVRVERETS